MTGFSYVAARADGGTVRGRIDALSAAEAAAQLSRRGLFPLAVQCVQGVAPRWRRPSGRSLALAFRGLASMVGAGVPLGPALQTTQRLAQGMLAEALGRIAERVRQGSALGSALEAERGLIPAVTIGLVRAGESGVGLGPALEAAANELERDADTTSSLQAALAYPMVLVLVGSLSLAVILLLVVPRFAEVLGDVRSSLPLATRLLLGASELGRAQGVVLAVCAVSVAGLAAVMLNRRRQAWHEWLLQLPVIGSIRHGAATVRTARVLAALLDTGTSALTAIRVAGDAAGDAAVARRLSAVGERVAQGEALSRALAEERALTPLALRLAAVGDGTGQLARMLAHAATVEDAVVQREVRTAVSLIEPVLIALFAAVVAFVALALLQAVYSIRPGAL